MIECILYPICKLLDVLLPRKFLLGLPIILYHSISDRESSLSIPIKRFEKQINYLYKKRYTTILPTDLAHGEIKGRLTLITFDDGFKDNLANARPILQRYGYKATVFISTDYISGKSIFCREEAAWNLDMLSRDEIKKLESHGWFIANHFASHESLVNFASEKIEGEYRKAKRVLSEIINNKDSAKVVSYPRSRYNMGTIKTIKKAGAKMAFAGGDRFFTRKDDWYAIPRIEIRRDLSMTKFKLKLSPTYNLFRNLWL